MEPTTPLTSIDILAPYLPYGIDIKTIEGVGKLIQLETPDADCFYPSGRLGAMYGLLGEPHWCDVADAQPMLRSFSQLPTCLPDGTVAAVEVAKLALSLGKEAGPMVIDTCPWLSVSTGKFRKSGIEVRYSWNGSEIIVGIANVEGNWSVTISEPDMGVLNSQPDNYLAIFNYLRSQHFAVGLQPHQFIEKVAPTPIGN